MYSTLAAAQWNEIISEGNFKKFLAFFQDVFETNLKQTHYKIV